MKNRYSEKINTRNTIKATRQKKYKFFAVFSAVSCVLIGFAILAALFIFFFKPYKIRKIQYVCDDSNFETMASLYAEDYIGINALGEISDGRIGVLEQALTHCLPEYKNITCTIKFGGTLTVSAEPRSNFVVFSDGDTIIVTDRDGYAVLISDRENYKNELENLPSYDGDNVDLFVKGFDIALISLGERIDCGSMVSWKTVAEVYFSVLANEPLESNINTVFFMAGGALYFYCEDNVYVNMGSCEDSDVLFERMERLSKIFNLSDLDLCDGTIFMTDEGFDTFRPNDTSENDVQIEIEH